MPPPVCLSCSSLNRPSSFEDGPLPDAWPFRLRAEPRVGDLHNPLRRFALQAAAPWEATPGDCGNCLAAGGVQGSTWGPSAGAARMA
mmetsp:Transcript_670/g.1114  ORF Transcript_670/g.1114 Transcript_670/m.1114 type:complete len:87 (-) Transcript_670:74-334(-)